METAITRAANKLGARVRRALRENLSRNRSLWLLLLGSWAILLPCALLMTARLKSQPAYSTPAGAKVQPHAAVSFINPNGTFILWSDGRITCITGRCGGKAPGSTVSTPLRNDPLPAGVSFHSPDSGSSVVAVGIVPTSSGTYVLYADGTVRNPGYPVNAPLSLGPRLTGIALTYTEEQRAGAGFGAGNADTCAAAGSAVCSVPPFLMNKGEAFTSPPGYSVSCASGVQVLLGEIPGPEARSGLFQLQQSHYTLYACQE